MCPLVVASLDNAENANCPTLGLDENAMMQVQKLARIGCRLFDSPASSANPKKNSRNCRDVSIPQTNLHSLIH